MPAAYCGGALTRMTALSFAQRRRRNRARIQLESHQERPGESRARQPGRTPKVPSRESGDAAKGPDKRSRRQPSVHEGEESVSW